ncbi:52 kDa repressor of the inhibitor of the protein kinase-like Protein [Tribolium castaneum]|uniref:52 kDa repressor of the inhibitor of the protein kinase-like Protein n=1 Tax=Tribolium castaneum TaxID=7070 RepID=A0A139WGD4_TRICA|nr:52 kDa repressor of the inhibitor of the protein kinase-like Protein [Tribolium castaneum]
MASETKGAVQELTKIAIHAKRCPCNNHVLNNSLARSSKVVSCRNTSGTMRKVVAFANASAKRHEIFKKELGVAMQGDNLVKICSALEKISTWQDSKTANDAHCLLQTLRSSDFIISSICLSDVLGVTVSLSRILQSNSIDLKKAADAINDTISVLQNKRENADVIYRQLFEEAKEVAGQLDVEIKCPRIVSRQIHRANNQPAQSAEEYFRRAIYIPLLDSIINDLEDRMSLEVLNLFQLSVFMPKSEYSNQDIETVKQLATDYTLLLDNTPVSVVVNEYRLWMMKWQRSQDMPQSISDLILNCDIEMAEPSLDVDTKNWALIDQTIIQKILLFFYVFLSTEEIEMELELLGDGSGGSGSGRGGSGEGGTGSGEAGSGEAGSGEGGCGGTSSGGTSKGGTRKGGTDRGEKSGKERSRRIQSFVFNLTSLKLSNYQINCLLQ